MSNDNFDPYQEMLNQKSPELFCDNCGHYPIMPMHGHFVCPECYTRPAQNVFTSSPFSVLITPVSSLKISTDILHSKNRSSESPRNGPEEKKNFGQVGYMPTKCCEGAPADV